MSNLFMRQMPPRSIPEFVRMFPRELAAGFAAAGETDAISCIIDLLAGRSQLWAIFAADKPAPVAVFRTKIVVEDAATWLCVSALHGTRLNEWADMLSDGLMAAAKKHGCRYVRFAGRRAWGRVLPAFRPVGEVHGETVFERAAA